MSTTSWTTVNADSAAAASATASFSQQSINSTPHKTRLVSHRYTHPSVNYDFRRELQRYQYSGISFEDFLMCSFGVSAEEMEALKKSVTDASNHTSPQYLKEQASFSQFAMKEEVAMYKPFAKMSNMVLNHHQKGSARKIMVLYYDGTTQVKSKFASRKPDVVIVPEKDGVIDLTQANALWNHMLCVLEFKKKSKSSTKSTKAMKSTVSQATSLGKREREEGNETNGSSHKRRTPNNSETKTVLDAESHQESVTASSSKGPTQSTLLEVTEGTRSSATPSNAERDSTTAGTASASLSLYHFAPSGGSKGKLPQKPKSNSVNPSVLQDLSGNSCSSTSREIMGPPAIGMQDVPYPQEDTPPAVEKPETPLKRTSAMPPDPQNYAEGDIDALQVQLANYITEVLSSRSGRVFAFGATVKHTEMRLTYQSRSMYAISDSIDVVKNPILFSVFLLLFAKQPSEKLGFNTDIDFCDPFNTKEKEPEELKLKLNAIEGGDNFRLKPDTVLRLGLCIHTEYCLIGRATAVYEIVRPEGCHIDLVVKLSWQVKSRRREDKAILIARSVDPEHSPEIYDAAVLDEKSSSATFKGKCRIHPTRPSEERELRILLMRKYEDVEDLGDAEFLKIIPQFVTYVHDLYSKRDLLHRDISIFNMAYYVKDDRKIATMIDFDLATFPDDVPAIPNNSNTTVAPIATQQPGEDRSGTTPFMAIEALDLSSPGYEHYVGHELESIFYCMVWHGVGYRYKKGIYPTKKNRFNKDRRGDDLLRTWRTGSWKKVKGEKVKFIGDLSEILSFITCSDLGYAALHMGRIMKTRQRVFGDRAEDKLSKMFRPTGGRHINPNKPITAIFPGCAEVLKIGAEICGKDCCVA